MFPLQIYTALKPFVNSKAGHPVCFPYKFTLLSNASVGIKTVVFVCFPYKFTLLSNPLDEKISGCWFVSPTNLHCSQTGTSLVSARHVFVSPTNLHCSQTPIRPWHKGLSLFPLQIYTALKRSSGRTPSHQRLFPLQIYTALKR